MPMIGSKPPLRNMTETAENKRPKNIKNRAERIIEIVLLKIISSPYNTLVILSNKSLGMPN